MLDMLDMKVQKDHTRRTSFSAARRALAALALTAWALAGVADVARAQDTDEEEEDPGLRIERIELSTYGGWIGGETYLDLLVPGPLTNDTASDEILDFDGMSPDPPVDGPTKEIEPGYLAGIHAAFFLNRNFAMALYGEYGRSENVFSGTPRDEGEIGEVFEEIDRATMSTFAGGIEFAYHLGNERRTTRRPFVSLGFGGILNQFENTDDVGALYFQGGVGYGFGITDTLRGFVAGTLRLYTWETDEVSLDSTLVFPSVRAGITWRYIVPMEDEVDEGA